MPNFEEIIGHKQMIEHLKHAIQLDKVSHAYIFEGEKGCGKKTIAEAFAAALQCEHQKEGTDACGICKSCKQAASKNHPDIIHIMHDKPNSIGVEEIREQVVNDIQIKPYSGKYKIYIISEAEKMTVQAQNALLKTIEEPPAYGIVMLLTDNASVLLPTILSRCVVLSMKPAADNLVKKYLMEHVQIPDYQADLCVAFAQGNVGKAIRLATSENFNEIKAAALDLLKHAKEMEMSEIIASVKAVSEFKIDIQDYLDLLAVWYRDVLYFKATKDINGLIFQDQYKDISKQAKQSSYEAIEQIVEGLKKANIRLKANVNFELTMELLFLQIKENR
ncbi:MAG: DNA polymerase III subunit delta' [Lachnospiraceae bacterium]|nr:DNA polymerase III subunit delta' [Robinsoniella sp.]MDY3766315.1 DNA polymerase III subunit delta' [Lachnospiraceae bacterium]